MDAWLKTAVARARDPQQRFDARCVLLLETAGCAVEAVEAAVLAAGVATRRFMPQDAPALMASLSRACCAAQTFNADGGLHARGDVVLYVPDFDALAALDRTAGAAVAAACRDGAKRKWRAVPVVLGISAPGARLGDLARRCATLALNARTAVPVTRRDKGGAPKEAAPSTVAALAARLADDQRIMALRLHETLPAELAARATTAAGAARAHRAWLAAMLDHDALLLGGAEAAAAETLALAWARATAAPLRAGEQAPALRFTRLLTRASAAHRRTQAA